MIFEHCTSEIGFPVANEAAMVASYSTLIIGLIWSLVFHQGFVLSIDFDDDDEGLDVNVNVIISLLIISGFVFDDDFQKNASKFVIFLE